MTNRLCYATEYGQVLLLYYAIYLDRVVSLGVVSSSLVSRRGEYAEWWSDFAFTKWVLIGSPAVYKQVMLCARVRVVFCFCIVLLVAVLTETDLFVFILILSFFYFSIGRGYVYT